ncbi:hypothetical protein LWI29_022432 [Acer saccharum]|uniref:Peptidase A2 domain-containing protein n=1 Tax=Acer saccharum TaxID=4024 RepID=A0AA39RMZ2_ACESA|nr:hypothetical protein LWI29_022432 [Acer saccharum]
MIDAVGAVFGAGRRRWRWWWSSRFGTGFVFWWLASANMPALALEKVVEKVGEQLCEAARKGDKDKERALVDSGANVSYFDGDGMTPL